MHESKRQSVDATATSSRLKLAEITSGVGALVLGIGIGAFFAEWIARDALPVVVVGALLHAFGMWDKHRMESRSASNPRWVTAAYWVCWVLLGAGAVTLMVTRLRLD